MLGLQPNLWSIVWGQADDQLNWRVLKNEKLSNLQGKLHLKKERLAQGFGSFISFQCEFFRLI